MLLDALQALAVPVHPGAHFFPVIPLKPTFTFTAQWRKMRTAPVDLAGGDRAGAAAPPAVPATAAAAADGSQAGCERADKKGAEEHPPAEAATAAADGPLSPDEVAAMAPDPKMRGKVKELVCKLVDAVRATDPKQPLWCERFLYEGTSVSMRDWHCQRAQQVACLYAVADRPSACSARARRSQQWSSR